eukprot:CAMPEP_0114250836 /NCGR_PEP_ID=MMETSP0058-20121206/14920_1 /TAXON_ID=36894 /ORGANISM="Pyramimonas parkeae, CCMP726" /LENGTH=316 /DNA_ID=CAMNT_0001364539 /DNA_START=208 /DNA_END=1158 /DNA_ORIENTATION=+
MSTLCPFSCQGDQSSFFTALFANNFASSTRDSKERLFVDRDGSLFAPILTWMRTGVISVEPPLTFQAVLREAQFYSISNLVAEIEAIFEDQNTSELQRAIKDEAGVAPSVRTDGYYCKKSKGPPDASDVAIRFTPSADNPNTGSLLWTQGADAAKNLRVMAVVGLLASSSVPSVWRDDPDTAEGVAFFMVHNVRRGTWTVQDSALTLRRGAFQGEAGLAALMPGQGEGLRMRGAMCAYYGVGLHNEILLAKIFRAGSGQHSSQFDHFYFVQDTTFEAVIVNRALSTCQACVVDAVEEEPIDVGREISSAVADVATT